MSSMFCKKIYQCRNANWCARDFNPKSDSPECFEQLTNYDRIISKTPEELAIYMRMRGCPTEEINNTCKNNRIKEKSCTRCWLDWLKSPVEEGEG